MTTSGPQRLRIRFAKRGRLRFVSHRDFQRAFERALRRAEVPIAFSQGFSPRPKVSYAGAAPTGAASEAEYLDITLTHGRDPAEIRRDLDEALPVGLDIVTIVEAGPTPLAERLTGSVWEIRLLEVPHQTAHHAVDLFLSSQSVMVERLTKSGRREVDARAAVVSLRAVDPGDGSPCAILDMVVRHDTPSVRPDDVLAGLRQVASMTPPVPPLVTRLAQGPLDETTGTVGDPLAPDRDAAAIRPAGAAVLDRPVDA